MQHHLPIIINLEIDTVLGTIPLGTKFFLERLGLGRSDWWSGWGFNSSWGAWRESSGDGVIIKELQAGTANLETEGST